MLCSLLITNLLTLIITDLTKLLMNTKNLTNHLWLPIKLCKMDLLKLLIHSQSTNLFLILRMLLDQISNNLHLKKDITNTKTKENNPNNKIWENLNNNNNNNRLNLNNNNNKQIIINNNNKPNTNKLINNNWPCNNNNNNKWCMINQCKWIPITSTNTEE